MPKGSTKEYDSVKESYLSYLKLYKIMNKGSLKGATRFDKYYIYKTYYVRYMEPHRLASHSYK